MGAAGASVFTVGTLVRPLPSVGAQVSVQVVLQSKALAAQEAGVAWSRARYSVHLQVEGCQGSHAGVSVWMAPIFCFTDPLQVWWLAIPGLQCGVGEGGVLGGGQAVEPLPVVRVGAAYVLVHTALTLENA